MPVEVYKGVEFQEADSIGKITVGEHTFVYVYDNGIISDLTVSSGGSVYIEENGNLGSAVINNGGEIYISAGGSADSVTISAGGSAVITGSVSNLYWTPGYGHLFVHDGADVTYASSYSGVYYGSKGILYKQSANMSDLLLNGMQVSAFVMSGGTAEDFTLQNGGNLYVYSGGYAEDIVFAGNGNMYIYSGGTASDITVTEGGHLYISSGASALNVIWTPGIGTVTVKDGGYITYADVGGVYLNSNGQFVSSAIIMNDQVLDRNMDMYVMSNGRALNVMVNSGGKLVVSSGGSASVKFNPWQGKGAVSSTTGAEVEFLQRDAEIYYGSGNKFISKYANTLSDFEVVSDTELFIYDKADVSNISAVGGAIYISGGVLQNISAGNGGTVNIYSGNLSNASINESGHINISGGILSTTHINSGGFNVTNGGSAVETIISQGSMSVSKASASDIILSAGLLSVVSGNLAEVVLAGGSMLMSAGGSASNVDVNSGAYMYIGADAAVAGNVLNNDGRVNVGAGGTLENMKISGGTMVVSSGGTALAVDWTPCVGNVNVMSGASVTFVKELSGVYYGRDNQLISNQASMKNSSVEQAVAHVMTGGSISDIIISSAGSVYMAGGSAERTTVNSSGLFHIYNGTVENTAINSNGKVFVYAGASLCNTTIASGGSLNLDSGAIHSGTMQLAAGAIVYTEEKTSIIFDISERNTADGWIINNFSQIQGTPSYVIKVSATQKAGTYKLAQGAENFNGTISVGDGSISYGSIKVNGSVFKYNEVDYKLTLEKGELDLSIGDFTAPDLKIVADKTDWTNTDVVLTASASDGLIEYFDGESWISGANMTVETNGTYTFRVTDVAGNVTEKTFEVTNIDKVAPTLEITGNAVEWTNKDIILTAVVNDGTVEFFNGEIWLSGNTFTISENGTYRFKVSDEAGNVTEQEVIVDKIDKIAPTLEI
ncbi:MAG: AIDA repeat-containing protein, partial [Lentisphaeria bacterium]|nr:AIDA repeat-containing protein [Lentisphaeria bacterium]